MAGTGEVVSSRRPSEMRMDQGKARLVDWSLASLFGTNARQGKFWTMQLIGWTTRFGRTQHFSYTRLYPLLARLLQSPAIAIAIARDCYILVVLFFYLFFLFFKIFFRPPNFRRPWADFAKLCHTARHVLK